MATAALGSPSAAVRRLPIGGVSPRRFAAAFLGFTTAAALLIAAAPIRVSIWTVFLFAGPHNWMEARYFLSRLPVRLGHLRTFFLVGFGGVAVLAVAFWTLPWHGPVPALWHTALAAWTAALLILRRREPPAADWFGILPLACLWMAAAWLAPAALDVAIVYAHPLLAFCFLDRQIRRSRPEWLAAWRRSLAAIPVLLAVLVWRLSPAPPLVAWDAASWAVIQHTNSTILQGISSRLLVATHAFLETTHYAIWLLALPLLGMRDAPWSLAHVPLSRHRLGWPRLIRGVFFVGAGIVLAFWLGFSLDYGATRQLYFTIAVLHVLAEVPFLVRLS